MGVLRDVVETDLPVFYEYECDPESSAMAAFPSRQRDAFMAHWAKVLASDALTWTVVADGEVAGNIGCWADADGNRFVGYWIGKPFWGRGLATEALTEVAGIVEARPLRAYVAKRNPGSIRVLEKCGFAVVDEHTGEDGVVELLMELRD